MTEGSVCRRSRDGESCRCCANPVRAETGVLPQSKARQDKDNTVRVDIRKISEGGEEVHQVKNEPRRPLMMRRTLDCSGGGSGEKFMNDDVDVSPVAVEMRPGGVLV